MIKKEYLLALSSVLLCSTLSPISKLIFDYMPEMELLFLMSLAATVFMLVVNTATGKIKLIKQYTLRDFGIMMIFGALGTFLYTAFYNYGIAHLAAQEACIINYTWPMMIVIFSSILLHERMTFRKIGAILISFLGIIVIVTKLDFENFRPDSLSGVAACLSGAVCYGLFSALNKKKAYDQFIAFNVYYFITAVLAGIMVVINGDFVPVTDIKMVGAILWMGIFVNALGYLTWCLALLGGDTSKISNIGYLTPFLAIFFSWLILDEPLNVYTFAGLGLILLGIFIQMKRGGDAK